MENKNIAAQRRDIVIVKQPPLWTPIENDNWLIFKITGGGKYYCTLTLGDTEIRLIPSVTDNTVSVNLTPLFKQLYDDKEKTVQTHTWAEATTAGLRGSMVIRVYNIGTVTQVLSKIIPYSVMGGYSPLTDLNYEVDKLKVFGSNYKTYFEGFPFWIDVLGNVKTFLASFDEVETRHIPIKITSSSSPQEYSLTAPFSPTGRIWFDRAVINTNTANRLQLNRVENELTLNNGNTFIINKQFCGEGIYLKWSNRDGGYSTYLFNRGVGKTHSTSLSGDMLAHDKYNVGEIERNTKSYSLWSNPTESISISASVDIRQQEDLIDLSNSKAVYMWTSTKPYKPGKWIRVQPNINVTTYLKRKARVSGTISYNKL